MASIHECFAARVQVATGDVATSVPHKGLDHRPLVGGRFTENAASA
jgi:hypothetical protein